MPRIETLLRLVLDDDYTIVADAIETAKVSSIFFLKPFISIYFYQNEKRMTRMDYSFLTTVKSYLLSSLISSKK